MAVLGQKKSERAPGAARSRSLRPLPAGPRRPGLARPSPAAAGGAAARGPAPSCASAPLLGWKPGTGSGPAVAETPRGLAWKRGLPSACGPQARPRV